MGFFDGLGGAIFGGVSNLLGGFLQNDAAEDAAQKQMDFQAIQSSTAYQRATQDMMAAGLNPMLAYQQGGASAGAGSSYQPQNVVGQAGSAAIASMSSAAQIANTQADTLKKLADTDLSKAGLPSAKFKSQLPDVGNQILDKVKSIFNNSASSSQPGQIGVTDLPALGESPTSAQAAGHAGTGASETGNTDWLTQLTSPPDKRSRLHKFVDQIGEWNPYGFNQ